MATQDHIRNFAIIAHIDHGKSTLADRLLEITGTVMMRDMSDQLLDSNPIERERGITIKLAPVRMVYRIKNDELRMTNKTNEKSSFVIHHSSFILNLIDTPGHVDFSYEVSRSLAACEGAVLVVDATQGIQAQTLANLHLARQHNLVIVPVINKIDLANARIEETLQELESLGFGASECIQISAKTGKNVAAVLEAIVSRIPPPRGRHEAPTRALVFSSQYDTHKGVVIFVRLVDGTIHLDSSTRLRFLFSNAEVTPIELGYFMPQMRVGSSLETGEVGYIATGLKDIRFAKVGDTVTTVSSVKHQVVRKEDLTPDALTPDTIQPLAGYREPKPMVFLGLFPVAADEFQDAREAMEKLRLSDSAFTFRPISSLALGNGFHCGFLGLLHAEIVQERLLREFGLTLLATAPSVEYLIQLNPGVNPGKVGIKQLSAFSYQPSEKSLQLSAISDQHSININTSKEAESCGLSLDGARDPELAEGKADSFYSITSASEYPDPSVISETREPVMQVSVFSPKKYVGGIMGLCQEKRGEYIDLEYIGSAFSGHESDKDTAGIAKFTYLMPLSEMIVDFFDRLKSATEGYASLDYEFFEYQVVDVVKMDILVNKEKVDAFATLVVKDQALRRGRELTERLAAAIPKQQFEIPVQAALGGQVIARADVKAFRKDVIAKLYGGDRTRKDKLLDKQKKGKAKMKLIGRVEIPQSAFFAVLKRE